jgi:hypothetical protein
MKFWNGLPTRQKVLAVVFLLTLLVAGIQLYSSLEEPAPVTGAAAANPNNNFQPQGQVLSTPTLAVLRDPFAVPSGYVGTVKDHPPSAASPASSSNSAASAPQFGTSGTFSGAKKDAASPNLSLTGIVGSGDSKSTIIRYGSDSRSYRIHDQVGPYEIMAISDHSVTLAGSTGHKVLFLGE